VFHNHNLFYFFRRRASDSLRAESGIVPIQYQFCI
jgi:hypothetical protein